MPGIAASSVAPTSTTFAVIGDYGSADAHERAVAKLVASFGPDFVIATGDCSYGLAARPSAAAYASSTGAYFGSWLKDVSTSSTDTLATAKVNAFFPALGNHDYIGAAPGPRAYLTYFDLPGDGFANSSGNERYYDFVEGPVHFFVLNSNPQEPDGTSPTSRQGEWLRKALAASTSAWNIVYDHHPPFSSDSTHGSTSYMRWPFAAWGADAVMSGHSHTYERIMRDGIPYFVNGLGGGARYGFSAPVPGSAVRFRGNWGAQKVTATDSTLDLEFFDVSGALVDRCHLPATPTP